jgi:hypothetical protein
MYKRVNRCNLVRLQRGGLKPTLKQVLTMPRSAKGVNPEILELAEKRRLWQRRLCCLPKLYGRPIAGPGARLTVEPGGPFFFLPQ